MRPRLFDERDIRKPATAQPVAKPRDEFEAASAATDDDNTMKVTARSNLLHLIAHHRVLAGGSRSTFAAYNTADRPDKLGWLHSPSLSAVAAACFGEG
jgi:hypothetical protein